ncbi:MAG: thiamine-monophosphate kinase [Planctomycetota bacterium]|jgi:thiamine-monophosphate kinase
MAWSEARLHAWLARREAPSVLVGSAGHDAAVLIPGHGRPVVCTDSCALGVHYSADVSPGLAGRKAANRALSDLAATAATPHALLLALRAPASTSEARMRALIAAVDKAGRAAGAPLVAGDLSLVEGPESLAVTALGFLAGRRQAPGRDRAQVGDLIFVTGPVGGSRRTRHLRFAPRIAAGRWLFERGARALMDVSDGLALDLQRMARASGVRFCVQQVPVHADARRAARLDARSSLDHALHDGEDHELIATLSPKAAVRLLREAPDACPGLSLLGEVHEGSGLVLDLDGTRRTWKPSMGGWIHAS